MPSPSEIALTHDVDRRSLTKMKSDTRTTVIATVQFDHAGSGPGTFTQYIARLFDGDPSHHLYFTSEDIAHPGQDQSLVNLSHWPWMKLSIFKGIAYRQAVRDAMKRLNTRVAVYNTSPAVSYFHAVDRDPNETVVAFISDTNHLEQQSHRKLWPALRAKLKSAIVRRMERRALLEASLAVVNSQYLSSLVQDKYDIPMAKIRLLYKAVDLQLFRRRDDVESVSSPVRILFMKSDYIRGGIADLLAALQRVNFDYRLSIVGPSASDVPQIKKLGNASQLNRVEFLGKLSRADLPEVYRSHDILCVPSHREALGVTFLEAMSSGISAVGTNVGGIPEVLDEGRAGWLVPPHSPIELATTLESIVTNHQERAERIRAGLEHVQKFSVERMKTSFAAILDEAHSLTR